MRIPTGMKQVQTILSRNDYIFYQCERCGKYHLIELEVKGGGVSGYHTLQSNEKKEQSRTDSVNTAVANLNKNSKINADKVNNMRDYSPIENEIICSYCQTVQTWSKWPKKWNKTKAGTALILCLFAVPFVCPWFLFISPILALLVLLALVFIPLGLVLSYSSKRKQTINELNQKTVSRPIYIYQGNIDEIMNSANGHIIADLLNVNNYSE